MNKKKLTGLGAMLAAIAAALVASRGGARKPEVPFTPAAPQSYTLTVHVFRGAAALDDKIVGALVESGEMHAVTDDAGNVNLDGLPPGAREVCASASGHVRGCVSVTVPSAGVDVSLERDVPPTLPVRVDGRFWVTDAGTFRPVFQSGLTLLVRDASDRAAFLDETRALGFNGVRVFAGALPWADQAPAAARDVLPQLLDEAAARGLYVYVSAITESRAGGYDLEAHLRAIAAIVQAHPNALLEVANETFHPTQADIVNDPARLLALARRAVPASIPYSLGAADVDEPDASGRYPTDGGAFNTAHLDRGRDTWNQVRRLREIAGISEATRKPAMSGEPIGADEQMGGATGTKQRRNDPAFFYAMGVLCRGFELGCVFHSEAGLQAQLLGPVQRECALAFMAGWRSIDTNDRLAFKNARWDGSPVADADFDRVVRSYSFVAGDRGWTVLVGLSGDPRVRWGGGWSPHGVVGERPGVQVVEIGR